MQRLRRKNLIMAPSTNEKIFLGKGIIPIVLTSSA